MFLPTLNAQAILRWAETDIKDIRSISNHERW